jgi:dolichol-phosphate mannosyltransferase
MTLAAPLVSVVFSFRNEEAVLPELLARVTRAFATLDVRHELVFVDDASTDRSGQILRLRAGDDATLRIVTMSRRFGVTECLMAGLRYASGDAVITMDADLQDPPELIPELVAKWRAGADVVYTVRTGRKGESAVKMLLTRLAYRTIRRISGMDLPVEAGDFRLVSRRVRDALLALDERDLYLRGLVRWVGFKQEPVYYRRESRVAGTTHFPLIGSSGPALEFFNAVTSFSAFPLFAILLLGLVLAGSGIAGALAGAVASWLGHRLPPWAWLCAAAGVCTGVLLAAIATVGLYVWRVFTQVLRRPHYLVESTFGFPKGTSGEPESRPDPA